MQQELMQRLEADLQAERDAHEATLRDAESTLQELEGVRGVQPGHVTTEQSWQAEERAARQQAEV